MTPEHVLLVLPVLMRGPEEYYADMRKYATRKEPELRRRLRRDFDFEEYLRWGPWLYNDTIGWLELGTDGLDYAEAALYMRRKFLPDKVQRQDYWPELGKPRPTKPTWRVIQNPDKYAEYARPDYFAVWYGDEIHKRWFRRGNSGSFAEALLGLVQDAQQRARQYKGHKFNCCRAVVWVPPFGLNCINWVEAIRQAKERAAVRKAARRG